MRIINNQQRRKHIKEEKKLEKKHYRIIVALMILDVVYYYFIQPKTIGHDIRYSIYIFWLPTLLGMLILALYRRKFLIDRFLNNKGVALWAFMFFFYLLQGLVFSYLSFGQIAKISWDFINYQTAIQNSREVLECDITRFWT